MSSFKSNSHQIVDVYDEEDTSQKEASATHKALLQRRVPSGSDAGIRNM